MLVTGGSNMYEFVKMVGRVFESHPFVNSFFEGVYKISDSDNVDYPLVALTINNISRNERTINYNINLLYADRLTDNRDNKLAVQSTGTNVLLEGLNAIDWRIDSLSVTEGYSITPFTEQFADNCAGVFTTVSIESVNPIGDCEWLDCSCFEC